LVWCRSGFITKVWKGNWLFGCYLDSHLEGGAKTLILLENPLNAGLKLWKAKIANANTFITGVQARKTVLAQG